MTIMEINALVAKKVMELDRCGGKCTTKSGFYSKRDISICGNCKKEMSPNYTEDIVLAWEIVEKLSLHVGLFNKRSKYWYCSEHPCWKKEGKSAVAYSAPKAICLAALKIKGVKIPSNI